MSAKQGLLSRLHPSEKASISQQIPFAEFAYKQIHSRNEFLAYLERELLRSDRLGQSVKLILLDLVDEEARHERRDELDQLAKLLTACTRRSDYKGWYVQDNRWMIGVIICQTNDKAIDAFLKKIDNELRILKHQHNAHISQSSHIIWSIYVYPLDWTKVDDGICQLSLLDEKPSSEDSTATPGFHATNAASWSALIAQQIAIPDWKRRLDIAGSLVLIILLLPVLLLIALLIILTSRGPVLYRQNRVGLNGMVFKCLKFRTMQTGYDSTHHQKYFRDLIESSTCSGNEGKPMSKLDNLNPQITLVGRILRPSHLDELPQLFNVLFGEMSLVGPRPCIPYEAERYTHWCRHRFETVPGITGLWQVKGKNKTTFAQMIRLDINYILRRSLWLDLQILFMTIPTIFKDVAECLKTSHAKESNHANEA